MKRSNSLRKVSSWQVKTDPKGTKKPQTVPQPMRAPKKASHSDVKKEVKRKRRRKISILRSSPPRPRGQSSRESSPGAPGLASSADLQSPRRAPRIPGLDLHLSPPPPADTPNSMRRRRRSGRGRQLRCRNRGCANTEVTFSTVRARDRHEQETCSTRIQVGSEML